MRIKRGVATHRKHLKVRQATVGMQHGRRRSYRMGKQALIKALQYATRDRHNRKRDFRRLWITRINNAAREQGLTYGTLMNKLKVAQITLDRKTLSELAVNHPVTFQLLIKKIK